MSFKWKNHVQRKIGIHEKGTLSGSGARSARDEGSSSLRGSVFFWSNLSRDNDLWKKIILPERERGIWRREEDCGRGVFLQLKETFWTNPFHLFDINDLSFKFNKTMVNISFSNALRWKNEQRKEQVTKHQTSEWLLDSWQESRRQRGRRNLILASRKLILSLSSMRWQTKRMSNSKRINFDFRIAVSVESEMDWEDSDSQLPTARGSSWLKSKASSLNL